MNPGPAEEASKVATGLIESLRSTPVVLSLVVFNIIFIVGVYFAHQSERASAERVISLLIQGEADMAKVITACTGR